MTASTSASSGTIASVVMSPALPKSSSNAARTIGSIISRIATAPLFSPQGQHTFDCAARPPGDGGIDGDLVRHGFERMPNFRQGDALHVRAQVKLRSLVGLSARPLPEKSASASPDTRIGYRVERPDGAADVGEEFGGVDLRAQAAGVDEDDFARDRLEGGAEMLHRLDGDGPVAGRVDAERGELGEIDSLAIIGDHDDVDAADAEHHRRAVISLDAAAHRTIGDEPAISQAYDLAGQRERAAAHRRVGLPAQGQSRFNPDPSAHSVLHRFGVTN